MNKKLDLNRDLIIITMKNDGFFLFFLSKKNDGLNLL